MPSAIEWTGETLNFIGGCTKKSEGCRNCYALRGSWRISHNPNAPARYQGVCEKVDGELRWTGRINLDREALEKPLRWREPRMIFVCSMSDLFHEKVPFEFIAKAWSVMKASRQHVFQVLTKRPSRMLEFLSGCGEWEGWITHDGSPPASYGGTGIVVGDSNRWPLPNVIGMVSAEDQQCANERIPILLQCPFAIRGVSIEPMLGSVDLWALNDGSWYDVEGATRYDALRGFAWWGGSGDHGLSGGPKLDWVIAGGESGPGARPTHPDLFRSLRDQCIDAGVPFFFKQWGAWTPIGTVDDFTIIDHLKTGKDMIVDGTFLEPVLMRRVGKKLAGRLLDGREWNQMPEVV
jgi:protein gp37